MADHDRAEYTEKIERKVEELYAEFQQLALAQMKKGEISARAKLADAEKRVRERRERLESELRRARKAGESAWGEVRAGLDSAWEELRVAGRKARAEFTGEPMVEPEAGAGTGTSGDGAASGTTGSAGASGEERTT